MKKELKVETIAEFLARGGEIKRYPMVMPEEEPHVLSVLQMNIHNTSLAESEITLGESRAVVAPKIRKPRVQKVNLSLIPAHLKAKLGIVE
jgi:hypothetical protein